MKKICPNLSNKQTAQEFGEMKRIFGEKMAHSLWSKNNGYSIDKAPNGAPSILFGDLLELCEGDYEQAMILKAKVYSDEFFKWFGDWTSEDKSNVSKIVDENGEPKSVYHTVGPRFDPSFKKFDTYIEGRETAIYHTDSLDMSVVKSICNSGKYEDPNDMYNTIDDRANHAITIQISKPYLADPTKPFLKPGLSVTDRQLLLVKLREYDPQLSIKCNTEGKWYITRSKAKISAFKALLDPSGLITKDEVLEYLRKALNGSPELILVDTILKHATTGQWDAIKFKIGGLEPGVAAQFNPADHSITIATGAMVKFRNNANLNDYVAQTILHELVHYYTYDALHNSSLLRQEAEELRHYIIDKLGDKADEYGLTDIYEMLAELTNVDFVNKLKSVEMPERKLSAILQKIKRFLKHALSKVFNAKEQGTAYEQAIELLVKASRPEEFAVPYDVKDNHTAPMKSITAAKEELDKIHGRITTLYTELYKGYQKQSNKSANKAKREDAIWSTILDLKSKDKSLVLEVSMMSALELIGVYETTPDGTVIPASPTTILGFLQQAYATDKLTNLTANQVQDMKANIIDFYNNLSREVNDLENTTMDSQDNELRMKLQSTVGEISRLWKIAANNVADRIVDENVDKYITAPEEEKQDMKIVAKNWLHRNDMWGDESWFTALFNYSRNNSPIIRQAFQIIQDTDAVTRKESLKVYTKLAKAYKAATSIVDLGTPGNWLTELMERYTSGPKKGQFTGLFRSAVNRGQFKHDQEEFIKDLNKRFDEKYGYHYVVDKITGEPYRSDTGATVEDEEWVYSGVTVTKPPYIEYLEEKELWLCEHANRRYDKTYYLERLSEPWSAEYKAGHGLSPKTMQRMDYINSHIIHIMQSCSEDGVVYPERLSNTDYKKLLMWRDALADLGNVFDAEGNMKEGEAYKMAMEITAWNDWKAQYASKNIDYTEFDKEANAILNEVRAGKRPYSDYLKFVDVNADWGIDSRLFDKVFKGDRAVKYYMSRMLQSSIKGLIKTKSAFIKDFHGMLWKANPDGTIMPSDMFSIGKSADVKNERFKRESDLKSGINPKDFTDNFAMQSALYYDDRGMLLSKDGTKTIDPKTATAGDYMTWYDYILKQYVDAVLDGRMKNAVGYDEEGKPVVADFSTMTSRADVEKWFNDYVFTYEMEYKDKNGLTKRRRELCSQFKIMIPKDSRYIRYIPKGRFANNTTSLLNPDFSYEDKNGVQPKFSKYGDREFVDMISKGGKKAEYYKLLLDTMQEHWKMLGVDDTYNRFKLPQIEASTSLKLGRSLHNIKGTIKNIKDNIINATSDDLDMRDSDDYVLRNGKWVLTTAPMRFINELEDPSIIDSDLASTVGRFAEMAINFQNKSNAQSKLDVLGYALDDENRNTEFRGRGNRQKERYDKMMKLLFFEAKSTTFAGQYEKPGKMSIAATKGLNTVRTATAYLMLGYNIPSMATGLWDAATQLPSHAARGERFGFKDLAKAFACNPAAIIRAIMNIGNPIPNCKQVAMMLKDGLVRDTRESYNKQYRNRLVKALSESATGGYTMGDYMMNLLIQRAAYNAKKYYPGEPAYGIPEGFYTKELFRALMKGKADSKTINREFLRGDNVNLWDAYTFDGRVAKVKPKYEKAVATSEGLMSANIQQLAALINGNSPKNDQSFISQNVIFKCFSLMRNYFFRRIEHWFAGFTPDNIVKAQTEVIKEEVRGGKTLRTKTLKWEPLSNEQKSRRVMYDYSSGIANPAELVNLGRLAMSSLRIINQHLFTRSKLKTDKRTLNKQETKAAKEFILWGLCLAAMCVGWMAFHRYVNDETGDLKPEDYEHSVPSWTNFVEQKNYLKLIDQVAFRVIDSQLQLFNPYQFVDIVKSATVMTNSIDKWAAVANWITEGNPDEAITSDSKYKYFTKSQRWIWSATPLGNIQTWSSWRGNEKVGRWYFDNTITGNLFKWGGYKWKEEQEKKSSKKDKSDSLIPDVEQYMPDESLMPDPNQYLPEGY